MKFLTYFLSLLLHGDLISTFAVFLKQLREENLVSQSHRFAPGTAQNMISGVRTWFFFCVFYQLQHCPATPCDLVLFLELMAITVTYNHLKHLLSSIKFYHRAQNLQFPEFDFNIVNTLQGIKRRQSHTPHQALPLTPDIMRAMYYHLDMSKQKDRALWCSYLITFYCLFRKSNSVPKSMSQVDLRRTLLRRHIRVTQDTVYVHCTFSKTIQFGQRDLVIPIPGNSDPAMDPVRHLSALYTTVNCSLDAPAFSYGPNLFITHSSFTSSLKKLLKQAGFEPSLYSGHSFRRGGATMLYKLGASILQIQASGDWASQCFVRYLHVSEQDRQAIQLLVSDAISSGRF